jgi:hypothetical protein
VFVGSNVFRAPFCAFVLCTKLWIYQMGLWPFEDLLFRVEFSDSIFSAAKFFRTVINYLRSQCTQLVVEESNRGKLKAILAEAEYYQVHRPACAP